MICLFSPHQDRADPKIKTIKLIEEKIEKRRFEKKNK